MWCGVTAQVMMAFFPKTQGCVDVLKFSRDEQQALQQRMEVCSDDAAHLEDPIRREELHLGCLWEQQGRCSCCTPQ